MTLLTSAMRASNDIGSVLRIAAEQARADQRLKRQRPQETSTYPVVIDAIDAVLIQSTLSGLVGGQMGDGSVKDGVKHATIMLGVTYAVLLALQSVSLLG